jgi:hypothetical protein
MPTGRYHLAHLNIGKVKAPLDDLLMADFVAKLESINQLAYDSPGFIWHLQIDINNPADLAMYGEPGILFNLSVWESPEHLQAYVYRSGHMDMMRLRHRWFDAIDGPNYVLWWLPAGTRPTLEDGKSRIRQLLEQGPSPEAFTFKSIYPAPDFISVTSL